MCHVRWIVRADPEAGLEMFTEMRPALPPETVLPILTNEVPTLCAPYLEAALEMGLASPAKFNNELALIYLRMAKERRDSNGGASTSGEHGIHISVLHLSYAELRQECEVLAVSQAWKRGEMKARPRTGSLRNHICQLGRTHCSA